jgi:hypothetical protein
VFLGQQYNQCLSFAKRNKGFSEMDFASKKTALLFTVAAASILSGCASSSSNQTGPELSAYQKKVLEEDQRTNEILAKAALLSAKSLAVFVRTEQAVHQPAMTAEQIRQARFQDSYIPVNMEQMVEFAWDAAPEPLMSSLASSAGYELKFMNERPPIPKAVTISSKPRMIAEYFDIIEQETAGYIDRIVEDDKSDRKIVRVWYAQF